MGVREITSKGKIVIPLLVSLNATFLAGLLLLTATTGSAFLPQLSWAVEYGLTLLKFLSYFLGFVTLALILKNGILADFDPVASYSLRPLALTWSLTAFTTVFFVLANALTIPFSQVANLGVLVTYGWDVSTSRAYLLMSLIALLVWLAQRRPKRSTIVSSGFFYASCPYAAGGTFSRRRRRYPSVGSAFWLASWIFYQPLDRKLVGTNFFCRQTHRLPKFSKVSKSSFLGFNIFWSHLKCNSV